MSRYLLEPVWATFYFAVFFLFGPAYAAFAPQPESSGAEVSHVRALFQKGEVDGAVSLSRKIIGDPGTGVDSLIEVGRILGDHKLLPEAQSAFARAFQTDPHSFPAAFNLGYTLFNEGKFDTARETLRRAVELEPASFQAHLLLGMTLLHSQDNQAALSQFREAERLRPNDADVLKLLAIQCSNAGSYQEAIAFLRRALELAGPEIGTYVSLVEILHQSGDDLSALQTAREALQHFPDSPRVNFLIGVRLQGLGRFTASKQYFQRSVTLDPSFGEAHAALGELAARWGRHQEAASFFAKAVALRPGDKQALIGLAESRRNLGDFAAAEQALLQALQLDPQCSRCHLLLSQIYLSQKQFGLSEKERLRALELERKSIYTRTRIR
jgi:tetratricopeptide (TPR) repeat protein